jgi:hypothetical protein
MSFKIGGCAVVLARKYVIILVGLIGVIVTVYILRSTVHLNTPEVHKGVASSLTWEDFLYDCGPRTSLRHRTSTTRSFEDKYRKRTFKWQGEVRNIREGFDVLFLHTKSVVMVRMYPPRFPRRDLPDVALLFGEERNAEVAELNPGDWIEFEATMTAHGHRGDPEVLTLWHIETKKKPEPLSSTPGRPANISFDAILKQPPSSRQGHQGSNSTIVKDVAKEVTKEITKELNSILEGSKEPLPAGESADSASKILKDGEKNELGALRENLGLAKQDAVVENKNGSAQVDIRA